MANVSARTLNCLDLLKKKVWVFQWHGAQIWPFKRVWLPEDYAHVRWIHIGQGWTRDKFFKRFDFKIVPNLISIDDDLHRPIEIEPRKRIVAFAPSNLRRGAVNDKGVRQVERACRNLPLDLIHGVKFTDCLKRKNRAWVGIDEVISPLYHRSGLEFLSQAVPCVCSYDDFTRDCLEEAVGTRDVPFIQARPDTLAKALKQMIDMEIHEYSEHACAARLWMEKWYHPRDLLQRHLAVYTG